MKSPMQRRQVTGAAFDPFASLWRAAHDDDEAGDALKGAVTLGLGVGEGALARTGGAGAAAAAGAKLGGEIGGAVGTVAGTVAVAAGIMGATTAACSVVPVIGTAVGAVLGLVAGLAYYFGQDTFHPSPLQAEEWLELFRADPGLLFAGVDSVTTKSGNRQHPAEELAARLVRYFKLVAGEVPNHGPLYNPVSDLSCKNPYLCRVDRSDPLTDPRHLRRIKTLVEQHRLVPPEISTPTQAASILRVLRSGLVKSGLMNWSEIKANLPGLRRDVSLLRALAGERGPDPVLGRVLRGDVSPARYHH